MNPPDPTDEFDARADPDSPETSEGAFASGAIPGPDLISVIGTDILVTGNIEAEVDLHIEGRVVGDVRCATLILGEKSSIRGRIFANRVRVSGTVEGAIQTVELAIEAAARVKGNVIYSRLRVANGGVLDGRVRHSVKQVAKREAGDGLPKLFKRPGKPKTPSTQ